MKIPYLVLFVAAWSGTALAQPSAFGGRAAEEGGLIGIFYDLKQTQKRNPTGVSPAEYPAIIREFLTKNWDESVLNRYFRATRPLYASQIFIPIMRARNAPQAFGVDDIVKPSAWVVHYKGQISPPEDGVYRFICYSDDMMVAAVNGRIVCNGSRPDTKLGDVWISKGKEQGPVGGNGRLVFGDWVPMKRDEPIDLDVIVGERPGGEFCAFLLYEKQGNSYPNALYPVLQLAAVDVPSYPLHQAPRFSRDGQLWKFYQ